MSLCVAEKLRFARRLGSQLQDRIAALEAEKQILAPPTDAPAASTAGSDVPSAGPLTDPIVARLRLELAEALRSQGQLQTRLQTAEGELELLRAKTKSDTKTIRTLTNERNTLVTKVRDRDEELRGKSKLVEVGWNPHPVRFHPGSRLLTARVRTCKTSS